MENSLNSDCGIQIVPEAAASPQIVYLDFDGAETFYNNDVLGLSLSVTVQDSKISEADQLYILSALNDLYKTEDIFFTFSQPADTVEYSTVYIGKTDAFAEYGNFNGLAETIDRGNQIKKDNAFVMLDDTSSNEQIINVIAHETDHIVKGSEHAESSNSIADYAMDKLIKTETATCEVIVRRSGGFYPGDPYVTGDYWYANLPTGATKAVITITNDGMDYSYGWDRCYTDIYVTVNGARYTIQEDKSKSITIKSNTTFSFSRDAFLELEVAYADYITNPLKPHIIIGYRYSYYSGYVKNKVTITAKYYNNVPIADLGVVSSQLSKTSKYTLRIDPSETFTYTFTVKNSGDLAAAASTATIYLDGKKLTDIAVKALAAGASGTYSYTFKPGSLANGSHSLYVAVDTAGVISEFNENDNKSSTSSFIIEPAMADLVIKNLTVADAENKSVLATDKDIQISFEVENRSENKASTAVTAALYAGDKLIKTFTVPAIDIGKSTSLTHTIAAGTLVAGSTQFKVVIDSANSCKEFDESNNTKTVTKTIYAPILPDLKVESIIVTNSDGDNTIYADKSTKVTVVIKNANSGNAALTRASKATELELQIDGISAKHVEIPELASGKSYTVEFTVPAGILTSYDGQKISALIDPENKCNELEEKNNISSIELTKAGCDLILSEPKCNIDGKNYEATVSFTVTNNSNIWSEKTTAFVGDGNAVLWDFNIDALAPGTSKTYEIKKEALAFDSDKTLYLSLDKGIYSNNLYHDSLSFKPIYITNYPNIRLVGLKYNNYIQGAGGKHILYRFSSDFENVEYVVKVYNGDRAWSFKTTETSGKISFDHNDDNFGVLVYVPGIKEFITNDNSGKKDLGRTTMGNQYHDGAHEHIFSTGKYWLNTYIKITSANISWLGNGTQELTFTVSKTGNDNAWGEVVVSILDGDKKITSIYLPYVDLNCNRTITCIVPADKVLTTGTHNLTLKLSTDEKIYVCDYTTAVTIDAPPQIHEPENKSTLPVIVASSTLSSDKTSAAVQATFSDGDGINLKQYSVDLAEWKNYTGAVNVDKNCTVYFKAVDTLGNVAVKACEVSGIVYRYADLQISSISSNVNTVNTKQPLTLNFTVKNAGDKASTATTAYIYDGTTKLGEVAIGALAVGGTFNGSFTIAAGKLALGAHTLKVIADGANVIAESNENNNSAEHSVTVVPPTAPDLTITSLEADAYSILTFPDIWVINNGNAASAKCKVYIYENDVKKSEAEVKALAPGEKVFLSSYFKHSGGNYTLKAVVDPTNVVAESNENNNTVTCNVLLDSADHFEWNMLSKTALTNSADGKSGSVKLSGHVGKGDAEDYFHVVGTGPAWTAVSISGLVCKAKVTLYDANKKKIKTYSLKGNGSIYTGYLPGDYYVAVTSADKGKGKYNTNYLVNINAVYAPGDAVKNNSFTEAAASAGKLQASNSLSGWVGMGDIVDCYKFTNNSGEKLSFTVTGVTAKLKLTVYDKNLKKVKSVSINKNGTYLSNLLVNGDFFVAIESADKGKKQHSNYNVSVKADIFPVEAKANNSRNTAGNLAQSGNGVVNTWDGVDAQIDDWVGFGDKSDYFAFEMTKAGKVDFDLNLDDASLKPGKAVKVTLYNAAGKKVALDKLMTTKKDLAVGKYFVEVATSNEKKYSSGYNLEMSIC